MLKAKSPLQPAVNQDTSYQDQLGETPRQNRIETTRTTDLKKDGPQKLTCRSISKRVAIDPDMNGNQDFTTSQKMVLPDPQRTESGTERKEAAEPTC